VVPAVAGHPVAEAVRILRKAGFAVVRRSVDGPQRRGLVVGQLPRPGGLGGGGEPTVTLRVASGWVAFDDDAVRGLPYDAARRALAADGLDAARTSRVSAATPGTVLGTENAPDRRLLVGSVVDLLVAVAPPPAPASVTQPHRATAPARHRPHEHGPGHGRRHGPGKGKGHHGHR
jgi:beta-lactam-binding protein with PASTA domain